MSSSSIAVLLLFSKVFSSLFTLSTVTCFRDSLQMVREYSKDLDHKSTLNINIINKSELTENKINHKISAHKIDIRYYSQWFLSEAIFIKTLLSSGILQMKPDGEWCVMRTLWPPCPLIWRILDKSVFSIKISSLTPTL